MPSTAADRAGADGANARPPVFLAEPGSLAADLIVLAGQEGRHAATVRRLTPGERVDVTDGVGLVAECLVAEARPGVLELAVRARRVVPRPDPAVVVVQALPKGDRGQLAVELMTEAGVDEIVPWAAQRCVTRWHGDRGERALARWRATARESAKQARRAWLPEVASLAGVSELVPRVTHAALAVLLDPAAPVSLATVPVPESGEIVVIVGPEGSVAPAESAELARAGAVAAHLGPTVLRTSSAGLIAAGVLISRSGRWG
ncbi:MAG TPA: 16S rRNA (uracil(1498)-N(3))-methyltransferase [Streptosporangiaceae bacterium]